MTKDLVADVLAAAEAAPKSTQQADRLYMQPTDGLVTKAETFRLKKKEADESERAKKHAEADLIRDIDAFREAELRGTGKFSTTVEIHVPDDDPTKPKKFGVQRQYTSRFGQFAADKNGTLEFKEQQLRGIVGDHFDKLFEMSRKVQVRSDVAKNPEKLSALIGKLVGGEAITRDEFVLSFEVVTVIVCKKDFDQQQFALLTKEQHDQLVSVGLKQSCPTKLI